VFKGFKGFLTNIDTSNSSEVKELISKRGIEV
jgi:hypothetical protein